MRPTWAAIPDRLDQCLKRVRSSRAPSDCTVFGLCLNCRAFAIETDRSLSREMCRLSIAASDSSPDKYLIRLTPTSFATIHSRHDKKVPEQCVPLRPSMICGRRRSELEGSLYKNLSAAVLGDDAVIARGCTAERRGTSCIDPNLVGQVAADQRKFPVTLRSAERDSTI